MINISVKSKWIGVFCVAGVFALCLTAPTLSFAGKSSYPGLIAPSDNKDSNSREDKGDRRGYKGLVSGRTDSRTEKSRNRLRIERLEDRRRKEILESRNEQAKQDKYSQQKIKQVEQANRNKENSQNNNIEYTSKEDRQKKLRDLRFYSSKIKIIKNSEKTSKQSKKIKVSDRVARILSKKLRKVNGLSPTEHGVKLKIDELFEFLEGDISSAERRENAKVVQEDLELLADTYYLKKSTPRSIYEDLGLPDRYIDDQKVAIDASIDRINKALEDVRRYL